jgi:hypothetical protein
MTVSLGRPQMQNMARITERGHANVVRPVPGRWKRDPALQTSAVRYVVCIDPWTSLQPTRSAGRELGDAG